jgi:hypothetical protein
MRFGTCIKWMSYSWCSVVVRTKMTVVNASLLHIGANRFVGSIVRAGGFAQ